MLERFGFTQAKQDINLLPKTIKRELRLYGLLGKLEALLGTIFIFMLVIFIVFLYVNRSMETRSYILKDTLNSGKYDIAEETYNKIGSLRNKISRVENLIISIGNPKFIDTDSINNIVTLMPSGVYKQTILMRTIERKIIFTGTAEKRHQITDFTDALYNTGNYNSISLSNLRTDENGTVFFTIEFYPLMESED